MMKRFLGLSVIVALVLAMVGTASAVLVGESKLTSTDGTAFIRIDWQVFSPGDATAPGGASAEFKYVYQVEATVGIDDSKNPNDVSSFTITFNPGLPFDTWVDLGGLTDLSIGSETNPVTGNPLTCCTAPLAVSLSAGQAGAVFIPNILQDGQSTRLMGTSQFGPIGGNGTAVDGAPGSPWASTNPSGEQIPIPIPEPATLVLLGLATGLAGFAARKRK